MNDGRECRICLIGNEEEELIQPCRCSTAFVHESCLQKWREQNRDNEKYNQCEICKASYVIYRQFPKETFELDKGRSSLIPSFCMYVGYLLISSLIIGLTDTITNFHSIVILNNGHEDMKFMDELNSGDSFTWILYYTNYTSYLICMFFSLYIAVGIIAKVHRKKEYFKQTTGKYIFYFLAAWNYFYNYHLFYKTFNRFDVYIISMAMSSPINYFIIMNVLKLHNDTIRKLNTDNIESIISVRYNPLIEIPNIDEIV